MLGLARTAAAEAGNSRALSFFLSRGKTRVAGSQCRRAAVMVAATTGAPQGTLSVPATGAPQGALSVPASSYPSIRRDASVVETLHGEEILDPYRWLEDPDSKETEAFVEKQNVLTASVLAQCKTRDKFKKLMTELYDYPRFSCPSKQGERYVYSHNTGLQAQSVMYTVASPGGDEKPTVLLDPNKLSKDGTIALGSTSFSDDGTLMAYTLSSGGSDWRTIHVLSIDQATGEPTKLDDVIEKCKFSSLAWLKDGSGFFYHKYPVKSTKADGTEVDSNVDKEMWFHKIGDSAENDAKLYVAEEPTWHIGAEVTDDGSYLLITTSTGCEPTNKLAYVALDELPRANGVIDFASFDLCKAGNKPLPIVKLVDNFDASYDCVANEGSVFTFHSNLNAPRYKIIRTDISKPSPPETWEAVIPEHETDLLMWAAASKGDSLVTCYLHDVQSVLQQRKLSSGELRREIKLPCSGPVSVSSCSIKRKLSEAFFSVTSFTVPGATFRMDLDLPEPPTLFRKTTLKGDFDPSTKLESTQVFVTSKDGTRVPMFIISPRGTVLDGSNPTLLYGYGGFNISLEPSFSVARTVFALGYGGVVAVANLRGGGEYGTSWRDAGSVRNKQNVFDDFQSCAEFLIKEKWTSSGKLITQGGSNGGLLVAACANQRPDLFGVVLAQVGVHDMLRFHKFTIGHAWVSDYGSPENKDDFAVLRSYSPIHNVCRPADGGQYPAVMITTGDHDDRVVPLHSHKLTATLQYVLCGGGSGGEEEKKDGEKNKDGASSPPPPPQKNPIITRIDVRAGHGAGKPTDKVIAEVSDMFGFAAEVVGAEWKGNGVV